MLISCRLNEGTTRGKIKLTFCTMERGDIEEEATSLAKKGRYSLVTADIFLSYRYTVRSYDIMQQ